MGTKRIPGPKRYPILGSALEFKKDPVQFFYKMDREFEGFCSLKLGVIEGFFASEPEAVKEILQTKNKSFKKGVQYKHLTYFLQNGLLTNEGESWFKQRRMVQPTFYRKTMGNFLNSMVKRSEEVLAHWKKEKSLDALTQMNKYTMQVIGDAVFSKDLSGEASNIGEALTFLIEHANERIQRSINTPMWLPIGMNRYFEKHKGAIDKVVFELITEKRHQKEISGDLTDLLLHVEDEETGEKMDDQQVRDELMTVFVAGHETTANALTWTMYLVAKHPEVEKKIKSEIAENLTEGFDARSLWNMPYIKAVIEESMRLYPPAWIMGRQALEDVEINGTEVQKGHDIIISPLAVHRSPRLWNEPDAFLPERFLATDGEKRHKYAYFPFGGGPRICIGEHFAMLEMIVYLTKLYSSGTMRLKNKEEVEMLPLVTLRPDREIILEFIPN